MFRDHLVGDEDVADKERAPSREQRISPNRHLRRYRVCVLLVLAIFGLHLLATAPGAGNGNALTAQQATPSHMSIQTAQSSVHRAPLTLGMGEGTSSSQRAASTFPAASCN